MAKKFTRVPADVPVDSLTPLNIKCGSSKCSDGLHCYSVTKKAIEKYGDKGYCKECGDHSVDWNRVHNNDIKDVTFTISSLKNELIRHVFWQMEIDDAAISYAEERGKIEVKEKAKKILKQKVGKLNSYIDGRQTPYTGNEIINYAQHATATCCRKCMELWHNIKYDAELTDVQLEFCIELVMAYVEERVPELTDNGTEEKEGK